MHFYTIIFQVIDFQTFLGKHTQTPLEGLKNVCLAKFLGTSIIRPPENLVHVNIRFATVKNFSPDKQF